MKLVKFFLNANKIAKTPKKTYLIFLLNPHYFFILGKSFYSLSLIFMIKIIKDKINKIKWSYFQNLRKLKYENNEIPNSLRGSLSCVKFLGSNQNALKYDMQKWSICITFQIENLGCYNDLSMLLLLRELALVKVWTPGLVS